MSRLPHPNAKFARAGLTTPVPIDVATSRTGVEETQVEAQGTRPQLPDILPQLDHRTVYADEIQIPAGTTFGPTASTLSAVYCIESVRVPVDTGEELSLVGVDYELLASDSAGGLTTVLLGNASSTAWGNITGTAAAVLVGTNLGVARKRWDGLAVYYAGVEAASLDLDSPQKPVQYLDATSFPTGKINDGVPNKLYLPKSYLPTHYPLTQGSTVDVLLAIRRSQVGADIAGVWTSAAQKALLCHIRVTLRFMKTTRGTLWRR